METRTNKTKTNRIRKREAGQKIMEKIDMQALFTWYEKSLPALIKDALDIFIDETIYYIDRPIESKDKLRNFLIWYIAMMITFDLKKTWPDIILEAFGNQFMLVGENDDTTIIVGKENAKEVIPLSIISQFAIMHNDLFTSERLEHALLTEDPVTKMSKYYAQDIINKVMDEKINDDYIKKVNDVINKRLKMAEKVKLH
ncbi:MAG: hypothetical protein QXV17_14435 [Candidatus Micrarchaeaceae archaeon]